MDDIRHDVQRIAKKKRKREERPKREVKRQWETNQHNKDTTNKNNNKMQTEGKCQSKRRKAVEHSPSPISLAIFSF
jgi:hypothetical protein